MDVKQSQRSNIKNNNNKNNNVPDKFYNVVSNIMTFVDEIDKNKGTKKDYKRKGDK